MEILLILLIAVLGGIWYMITKEPNFTPVVKKDEPAAEPEPVSQPTNALDVNSDGKVDIKDAVEVVKKTRTRVKKAADQDGDGKLTTKDIKIAASKAKSKVKEAAVAKTRGRKPSVKA
ncbi:MAG: hypothetical protein EBU90_18605 [Proteobacteria bacterium]|nr:hypothetical protein [Pseudomonadota bacterium]NBP14645.1 hypothetical protein [bacterium]